LLLSQFHELRGKVTHDIAIERHDARDPEAVEDRKQHQRVFDWLTQRLRALDRHARSFEGRFRLGRRIALNMHKSVGEPDPKLDLFTA
jgi:hypothetical protein